ncbi:hypothetical protein [Paenibacillus sp. PSB04]|uniref:YobI family P-loop NTPase n=1 Tax=Paenibacillus sp. PSB04 TaxID=2866810 RepID=UPI0039A154BA
MSTPNRWRGTFVNVAVSGAYGSRKSSVIASYKKRHSELRFVHVSLAHRDHPEFEQFYCEVGHDRNSRSIHFVSYDIMTLADLTSRAVGYVYYLQRM